MEYADRLRAAHGSSAGPSTTAALEGEARLAASGARTPTRHAGLAPSRAVADAATELEGRGGEPLGAEVADRFGRQFGFDFSRVRIHAHGEPAASAVALGAPGFTIGRHVAFAPGRYDPVTPAGRELLGHELAHVAQTGGQAVAVLCGPNGAQSTPTSPWSVDRDDYSKMVKAGIARLNQVVLDTNTFTGVLRPLFEKLVDRAAWRDENGKVQGGSAVSYAFPGATAKLAFTLVLDDARDSPLDGRSRFAPGGTSEITLFVRNVSTSDGVVKTLYHEGIHILHAILNHTPKGLEKPASDTFGVKDPAARRNLDMSNVESKALRASVRHKLIPVLDTVNATRKAGHTVDASGLDRVADTVVEELQVMAETEVARLFLQDVETPNAPVKFGTFTVNDFLAGSIVNAMFLLSGVFTADDKAALGDAERARIVEISEGLTDEYVNLVKRRYSESFADKGERRPKVDLEPSLPEHRGFMDDLYRSVDDIP